MEIHEREFITKEFELVALEALLPLTAKYMLTMVEYLQFLQTEQSRILKSMLRQERHPSDPNQPAGLK